MPSSRPTDISEILALYETTQEICSRLDLDQVLHAIVGRANQLLKGDVAYLAVTDDANQALRMRAWDNIRTERFRQLNMRYGVGLGGAVASERRPISTGEYITDANLSHAGYIDEIVAEEGIKSAVGVPVEFEDQLLAILFVAKRRRARFSSHQVTLLSSLANSAAIALHNARVHARLAAAMSIHTRLLELSVSGRGLSALAETLAELVSGPVLLLDGAAQEMASAAPGEALVNPGRSALECQEDLGDGVVARPILLGDQVVEAWLLARPGPGDPELQGLQNVALEQAVTVFALELARTKSVEEAELSRRADLLDELLRDRIANVPALIRQAGRLGIDLTLPWVVGVASARSESPPQWRRVASLIGPAAVPMIRGSHLVLFLPAASLSEAATTALGICDDAREAGIEPFVIGLGRVSKEPADFSASHAEAVRAVAAEHRGPVVAFESLHFHQLVLGARPAADVSQLATSCLAGLIEHDDRSRRGSLVKTLATYLGACGNLEATARRLSIHPNTLRGRLARIEALTDRDLQDANDRLDLQLALATLDLL